MIHNPTIIEQPSSCAIEAARAKWWRINTVRLSRSQLAEQTGYSPATIAVFERGYDAAGRSIEKSAWKQYRMAYAAVHWNCVAFDWQDRNVEDVGRRDQVAEPFGASP
jgi:hypothetical protein